MADPLFEWVSTIARSLGAPVSPPWKNDVATCLAIVNRVQAEVIPEIHGNFCPQQAVDSFAKLAADPSSVPGVPEAQDRMNVLLRLWWGCLAAAKTIALGTRDGPNTGEARRQAFEQLLDPIAAVDPVCRAGIRVAPAFKGQFYEEYSLEGVPIGSAVREAIPAPSGVEPA